MVHDGINPTHLFGTDLHSKFISIGAELFRDEASGLTFVRPEICWMLTMKICAFKIAKSRLRIHEISYIYSHVKSKLSLGCE